MLQYIGAFDGSRAAVDEVKERYRLGRVGDVEVKERLAGVINRLLAPWQERRACLARDPGLLDELVARGTRRARALAGETLRAAQHAMGFTGAWSALGLARGSNGHTLAAPRRQPCGRTLARMTSVEPAEEDV